MIFFCMVLKKPECISFGSHFKNDVEFYFYIPDTSHHTLWLNTYSIPLNDFQLVKTPTIPISVPASNS